MTIARGNTETIECIFKEDGVALDITGMTVLFTVKVNESDTYAQALIKKIVTTHSDVIGVTYINLTTDDTLQDVGEYTAFYTLYDVDNRLTYKKESFIISESEL